MKHILSPKHHIENLSLIRSMSAIDDIKQSCIYIKEDTINFILHVTALIKTRDPCKKCLVKACCTEGCEEKAILDNFLFVGVLCHKNKIMQIISSIKGLLEQHNMHLLIPMYMCLIALVVAVCFKVVAP